MPPSDLSIRSSCIDSPSDAEVASWQQMLADHMSFPQMLFEISGGEEARTREAVEREAAADALRLTYRAHLRRPATDADVEFWQASMKGRPVLRPSATGGRRR